MYPTQRWYKKSKMLLETFRGNKELRCQHNVLGIEQYPDILIGKSTKVTFGSHSCSVLSSSWFILEREEVVLIIHLSLKAFSPNRFFVSLFSLRIEWKSSE